MGLSNLIVFITLIGIVIPCRVLILSGGGSHSAYQSGTIQGLLEDNPDLSWDVITGISGGSINAYYLASRRSENSLYEVATNLSKFWQDVKTQNVYTINLDWSVSLFNTKPLYSYLWQHVNGSVGVTPAYVGSVSLETGDFTIFYSNPTNLTNEFMVETIMASTAMPVLFPPHIFEGQHWIDGGIINDEIINKGIQWCNGEDEIIADVIINSPILNESENVTMFIWDILLRTINILFEQFDNYEFFNPSPVKCQTLTINIYKPPQAIPYFLLDFDHGYEIWKMGYMNHQPNVTYSLPCYQN